jgi:hypothetical protein
VSHRGPTAGWVPPAKDDDDDDDLRGQSLKHKRR